MFNRWWKWKSTWLGLVFLTYLFVGYFLVPWWVQHRLGDAVKRQPNLQWRSMPEVSLNPVTFVMTLEDGHLLARDRELFRFDQVSGDLELFYSLLSWQIYVDWLTVRDPVVSLRLDEQGRLNLNRIAEKTARESEVEPSDWPAFSIGSVELSNGQIRWADHRSTPEISLTLSKFDASLDAVSWPLVAPWGARLEGRLEPKGTLRLSGEMRPAEGRVDLDYELDDGALTGLNGYLRRFVEGEFSSGGVELNGQLSLVTNPLGVDLRQTLAVHDAELTDAGGTPVLAVEEIQAGTVGLRWPEKRVTMESVDVDTPVLRVRAGDGYQTNLGEMFKPSSELGETLPTPPDLDRWVIAGGTTSVRGARVHFRDQNVEGGFSTQVNLSGTATPFHTANTEPMTYRLEGTTDRGAQLSSSGTIRLASPGERSQFEGLARNISLVSLNPYALKYIGYRIDRGKLRAEFDYQVRQRSLRGSNRLRIDQFVLGPKGEQSPVLDVPIKLAIGLLRDDRGNIDLDIPLEGNLDRARFQFDRVVRKAIQGTLTSIVNSPFRFLSGLVNVDAEELGQVSYRPGEARPLEQEETPIQQLSKALARRPGLNLGVRPVWSRADRDWFARRRVDRMISSAGGTTEDLEESLLTVESVYIDSVGRDTMVRIKSRLTRTKTDGIGRTLDRTAYVKALYEDLVASVEVDRKRLEELADRRAREVIDRLVDSGIEGKRLFVLDRRELESNTTPVELPLVLREGF